MEVWDLMHLGFGGEQVVSSMASDCDPRCLDAFARLRRVQ